MPYLEEIVQWEFPRVDIVPTFSKCPDTLIHSGVNTWSNSKEFIRDLWALLRPYWTSEERRSAWLLLVANIVLTLAMVYMTILFNQWYNLFYNTLQDKAQDDFSQIGRFCV